MGSSAVFFQKQSGEATGKPSLYGILSRLRHVEARTNLPAAWLGHPQSETVSEAPKLLTQVLAGVRGNLRALLMVVASEYFSLCPEPVFRFLPRRAPSLFVKFVSPLANLRFQVNGSRGT